MSESKLVELSMNFAVQILKMCERIKGHYSIVNQLERSGTSIGANIRESKYAQSKADFISKLQIALKECYETEYWLELMSRTEIIGEMSAKIFYTIVAQFVACLFPQLIRQKRTQNEFFLFCQKSP